MRSGAKLSGYSRCFVYFEGSVLDRLGFLQEKPKETLADSESGGTVSYFFLVNADASSFKNPEFARG